MLPNVPIFHLSDVQNDPICDAFRPLPAPAAASAIIREKLKTDNP